ncbi:hypothetical protein ACHAWU_001392 [Discostella pseudostelligera]|uniref:Uncharacterized protein n=1 Tax=Discostella pseudostelligera TaxID=259834 RepID=A0ABD3M1S6_9STRA
MPPPATDESLPPIGVIGIGVPTLPELPGINIKVEGNNTATTTTNTAIDEEVSEAAAVAALACVDGPEDDADDDDVVDDDVDDEDVGDDDEDNNIKKEEATTTTPNTDTDTNDNNTHRIRRNKKCPLTPHEALTFFHRGIYIDVDPTNVAAANAANSSTSSTTLGEANSNSVVGESGGIIDGTPSSTSGIATVAVAGSSGEGLFSAGIIRCSCNHKPTYKWDAYGYSRHFEFKCHLKYEEERLDEAEATRLKESKENYLRMYPLISESGLALLSSRKKRKFHEDVEGGGGVGTAGTAEKMLTGEELRIQERHWMEMWKEAKNELKQLREDLKQETDEEVRKELLLDIEGWKKRKGDWAKLLGLNEGSSSSTMEENGVNIAVV